MRIRVPICGLSQPSDYAFTLFTSYPVETGPPKLWNLTMKSWFAAAVVGAVIGQSFIQTDLALGQTQTQARPLGQNGVGQNGIGQNTVGKSATPQPKQQNRPANNIPGTVAVTSQTSFPIHFSVDKDADSVAEVQLFISSNQGKSWKLYSRHSADVKEIPFQTQLDGMYWFATRIIRKDRVQQPQDNRPLHFAPKLRIQIDRQLPQVSLSAYVVKAGEVQIRWNSNDPTLNPATIKMEYQSATDSQWLPIDVDVSKQVASANGVGGQMNWWPKRQSRAMNIRVQVADRAGNIGSATQRFFIPKAWSNKSPAEAPTDPNRPTDPFNVVGQSVVPPAAPWASDGQTNGSSNTANGSDRPSVFRPGSTAPDPTNNDAIANLSPTAMQNLENTTDVKPISGNMHPPVAEHVGPVNNRPTVDSLIPDESLENEASNNRLGQPNENPDPLARENTFDQNDTQPATSANPNIAPSVDSNTQPNAAPNSIPSETSRNTIEPNATTNPSVASNHSRPGNPSSIGPNSINPINSVPAGQIARMTRARRFKLSYATEGVGPSGVARVELWYTRDGGRQWSIWGEDSDRQSPFIVDTKEDGIYGFQIIIVNNDGFAGRAPASGSPADIWVGIDTQAPVVQLTSAIYGSGQKAGILDIRWSANDESFSQQPVSLYFSTDRQGPWTTIAAGLPNNGQYEWRADARIPREIYLRIQARDKAGNVNEHILAEPISLDGLAPRGRIDGLAPIEEARRRAYDRWSGQHGYR
jgi:hypothetical protein